MSPNDVNVISKLIAESLSYIGSLFSIVFGGVITIITAIYIFLYQRRVNKRDKLEEEKEAQRKKELDTLEAEKAARSVEVINQLTSISKQFEVFTKEIIEIKKSHAEMIKDHDHMMAFLGDFHNEFAEKHNNTTTALIEIQSDLKSKGSKLDAKVDKNFMTILKFTKHHTHEE